MKTSTGIAFGLIAATGVSCVSGSGLGRNPDTASCGPSDAMHLYVNLMMGCHGLAAPVRGAEVRREQGDVPGHPGNADPVRDVALQDGAWIRDAAAAATAESRRPSILAVGAGRDDAGGAGFGEMRGRSP